MTSFLTRILGDKKECKTMEARADGLPRDYAIVYGEMKSYLWRFASGDGMGIVALLKDVLELFETSAAQDRRVLDATLRRAPARHCVLPGHVAGLAQTRRGHEARRLGPC